MFREVFENVFAGQMEGAGEISKGCSILFFLFSFFSLSFLYLFHSHFVRCWQLELKWLTSEPEAEVRCVWELHGSGLWTVHPLQGRVCLSASMCFSVASAGFFWGERDRDREAQLCLICKKISTWVRPRMSGCACNWIITVPVSSSIYSLTVFFTGLAYKYSHLEGLYLSVGMVLHYLTLYLIVWSLSLIHRQDLERRILERHNLELHNIERHNL